MLQQYFQAKIDLQNAVYLEENKWTLTLGLSDGEGVNSPYTTQLGDVVILDTSSIMSGTLAHFTIDNFVSKSFNSMSVDVTYGGEGSGPDLNWVIGAMGIISRPSEFNNLLPVPSADSQGITDKYSFYTLNFNLLKIIDELLTNKVSSGTLTTASEIPYLVGVGAVLPSKPKGDVVHNTAILHLNMGAVMSVYNVSVYINNNDDAVLRIEEEDEIRFQDTLTSITVSYLQ